MTTMMCRRRRRRLRLLGCLTFPFWLMIAFIIVMVIVTSRNKLIISKWNHYEDEASSSPASIPHRLLCFVLADARNIDAAIAVKETWGQGKGCDTLLFFSSEDIPEVESIVVMSSKGYGDGKNINGYSRLWGKVRSIWQFIAARHLGDFDWFLKADDDTFIVVENLRRFIERRDPGIPVWYGAKLTNPKVKDGYQSGGAGYLLSKEALKRLGNLSQCSQSDYGYEDLQLGRCLERVDVVAGDTRDSNGLPTFLPFPPGDLLFNRRINNKKASLIIPNWFIKQLEPGWRCCSPDVISFHQIKPKMMYAMDFLIYTLRRHQQQ